MGVYGPDANANTSPVGTLEGIKTAAPIYLGWDKVCSVSRNTPCTSTANCPATEECVPPTPTLIFKHQVSLMDSGYDPRGCINSQPSRSSDKGVIAVQFADTNDNPVGSWIKQEATIISNGYDQQSEDNYVSCFFDPIDDGNTEDTYCFPPEDPNFDPTCVGDLFNDPNRRLGPSSTCFPGFSWSAVGDTINPFGVDNVFNGDPGSGLQGATGRGTWVESIVDLSRFKGQRLRLRFVTTGLKASGGTAETWEIAFAPLNPRACDDGWWIDDMEVQDALTMPATVSSDNNDNSGLPGCGADCAVPTAALAADPSGTLPAPGQTVQLDASGTDINRCLGGTAQYQFCVDGNSNNVCGDPADTLLRGYTDNPVYIDAPVSPTRYLVEVRCSSSVIFAPNKDFLQWIGAQTYNFGTGTLANVSTYVTTDTGVAQGPATQFSISGNPPASSGAWWLFRVSGGGEACNATNTYGNLARDNSPNLP
jgi:hypothetical protein